MRFRVLTLLVAGVVLVLGVVFLALPVTVDLGRGDFSCGTGFSADTGRIDLYTRIEAVDDHLGLDSPVAGFGWACDNALTNRRLWAWPLAGLGALGLLGAALLRRRRTPLPEHDW